MEPRSGFRLECGIPEGWGMNRRMTLLFGGAVALVLFALMAITIRGTDPWTADPALVATMGDKFGANFDSAKTAVEAGQAVNGADLHAQGASLSTQAHKVADAAPTWGSGANLTSGTAAFTTELTVLDAKVAALDASAPTADQLAALGTAAHDLADAARGLQATLDAQSVQANDQTTMVDALFGGQVIAFEVLGILLTAAMIGALVIARPLEAPADDSHYSHPTTAQVAESDHASDPAAHALRNPVPASAPATTKGADE
jgi:hypothetical protein